MITAVPTPKVSGAAEKEESGELEHVQQSCIVRAGEQRGERVRQVVMNINDTFWFRDLYWPDSEWKRGGRNTRGDSRMGIADIPALQGGAALAKCAHVGQSRRRTCPLARLLYQHPVTFTAVS